MFLTNYFFAFVSESLELTSDGKGQDRGQPFDQPHPDRVQRGPSSLHSRLGEFGLEAIAGLVRRRQGRDLHALLGLLSTRSYLATTLMNYA